MNDFEKEIARMTMIDHYENPRQKITNQDCCSGYQKGHHDSPSCIDNIDAFVQINDQIIQDIKFSGPACAICTSSTDIMAQYLIGQTIDQAKQIITNYLNMILSKPYDASLIEPLLIYQNVNKQANRIKCAMTGIQAILNALENYAK